MGLRDILSQLLPECWKENAFVLFSTFTPLIWRIALLDDALKGIILGNGDQHLWVTSRTQRLKFSHQLKHLLSNTRRLSEHIQSIPNPLSLYLFALETNPVKQRWQRWRIFLQKQIALKRRMSAFSVVKKRLCKVWRSALLALKAIFKLNSSFFFFK